MRSRSPAAARHLVIVCILTAACRSVLAADAPATMPAPSTAGEQELRAHFASKPRHLFGCGIIWADWIWPKDESKWPYDGRCMDMIRRMGGTHCPINIPWANVEPEPGKWYWDYVDHQVAEAEKRNLAMFAYTGLTPDWALPPEAPPVTGIGYRFPPPEEREEQFIAYCRNVARRYKGRIAHYQFWNEPNGCSWVNDGCSNGHMHELYTRWLKVWYKAFKSEDPGCVLGAGALDCNEGVDSCDDYLEGMYRAGAKDHFDAFNIHPYDKKGILHNRAIEEVRRVMVEHGDGRKGLWISEWGWSTSNEDDKADRIVKALEELTSPKYYYITMANYLSLSDPTGEPGFGLCDRDLTPRKSYRAYWKFTRDYKRRASDDDKDSGR